MEPFSLDILSTDIIHNVICYLFNAKSTLILQTQKMYKWIQPKWCRDDLSGAVPLPASGTREVCPPCNPGMEYYNGSCRFCTSGEYSDGIMPCQACSASTAPERGLIYKWWNNLPPQANVSSACLSFAGTYSLYPYIQEHPIYTVEHEIYE